MSWIEYYKQENKLVDEIKSKSFPIKLPSPPGFNENVYHQLKNGGLKIKKGVSTKKQTEKSDKLDKLKSKRLWEITVKPAKSIPMNVLMMWMTPNSIQIISIMMILMLVRNAINDILSVNAAFKGHESDVSTYDLTVMKLLYVLCCSGNLIIGIWKLNSMGLIPNKTSDWISWEQPLDGAETVIL